MFHGLALDESKKAKLEEAMGWFEAVLKNHSFAAGPNFTLADISLCVTVSQIESFKFEMNAYPRIKTWLKRCKHELAPYGYEVTSLYNYVGIDFSSSIMAIHVCRKSISSEPIFLPKCTRPDRREMLGEHWAGTSNEWTRHTFYLGNFFTALCINYYY